MSIGEYQTTPFRAKSFETCVGVRMLNLRSNVDGVALVDQI
jgi:hypothetical protein